MLTSPSRHPVSFPITILPKWSISQVELSKKSHLKKHWMETVRETTEWMTITLEWRSSEKLMTTQLMTSTALCKSHPFRTCFHRQVMVDEEVLGVGWCTLKVGSTARVVWWADLTSEAHLEWARWVTPLTTKTAMAQSAATTTLPSTTETTIIRRTSNKTCHIFQMTTCNFSWGARDWTRPHSLWWINRSWRHSTSVDRWMASAAATWQTLAASDRSPDNTATKICSQSKK